MGMDFFALLAAVAQENNISNQHLAIENARRALLDNRQRYDLLNFLIAKNRYSSYLEIGIDKGHNFAQINAERKIGVDPASVGFAEYLMTSDAFFARNQEKFDLIFVDGLHLHEQVLRDVKNGLECLNPGVYCHP